VNKKHFVFISAPRDDLKAERKALEAMVVEMGASPVSREQFAWEDPDGRRIIKQAIDEADYAVFLAANAGGPLTGTAPSIELEYLYAVRRGVPVIGLVLDGKARRKAAAEGGGLDRLKARLRRGVCGTWSSQTDLVQKGRLLLGREMALTARPGWARGGGGGLSSQAANELARLLEENARLKALLPEAAGGEEGAGGRLLRTLKLLAANTLHLSFFYDDGDNWENTRVFRHLRLFRLLCPELLQGQTCAGAAHFLGNILNPDLERKPRGEFPVPSNTVKKALSDFALLGLVRRVPPIPSITGGTGAGAEHWELTPYGREVYAHYRLRQMERVLKRKRGGSQSLVKKGRSKRK